MIDNFVNCTLMKSILSNRIIFFSMKNINDKLFISIKIFYSYKKLRDIFRDSWSIPHNFSSCLEFSNGAFDLVLSQVQHYMWRRVLRLFQFINFFKLFKSSTRFKTCEILYSIELYRNDTFAIQYIHC